MPTILVVDDSMFARLTICNMLQSAGYKTAEAAHGREGLQKVETERPDCIISDLLMPGLDGIGFLSALRERDLQPPVIVEHKKGPLLHRGALFCFFQMSVGLYRLTPFELVDDAGLLQGQNHVM